MSLNALHLRTRRRLRWHGWVLTLWCLAVGVASSWVLLHLFDVTLPAARYAMSAVLMYALGLVFGVQVWLRHFAASVRDDPSLAERVAPTPPVQRSEAAQKSFDWSDILGSAADLLSFDEAGLLLLIPALVLLLVGLLFAGGLLPVMLVDGLAGLLAEVAVQFVFGTLIARRVLRPASNDDAFLHILGKTWLIGLLLVLVSGVLGWALRAWEPGLVSIGQLLR
jgi:hypothetical protein